MSESAFGVEHGEFSKAGGMPTRRKREAEAARKERIATRKAQNMRALDSALAKPGQLANAKVSIADVGRGAAKPFTAVGNFAGKHPGAAGAAAIGGGGYGAYRLMRRDPKKKR